MIYPCFQKSFIVILCGPEGMWEDFGPHCFEKIGLVMADFCSSSDAMMIWYNDDVMIACRDGYVTMSMPMRRASVRIDPYEHAHHNIIITIKPSWHDHCNIMIATWGHLSCESTDRCHKSQELILDLGAYSRSGSSFERGLILDLGAYSRSGSLF